MLGKSHLKSKSYQTQGKLYCGKAYIQDKKELKLELCHCKCQKTYFCCSPETPCHSEYRKAFIESTGLTQHLRIQRERPHM